MADHDSYIYDDLWNIFSIPKNTYFSKRSLNGSDIVAACHELNIDLASTEENAISQTLFEDREKWMDFMEQYAMKPSTTWCIKLHSYYWANTDFENSKTTQNALACYQWRLPKYSIAAIAALCSGFIRQESNRIAPDDIIGVMVHYVFDNVVDEIKTSKAGDIFQSGIFEYKLCKFYMSLKIDNDGDEEVHIKITWISGPKDIAQVEMECILNLKEKFINILGSKIFWGSNGGVSMSFDFNSELCLDQIKHLNDSLTFSIYIKEFTAYSEPYSIGDSFDKNYEINFADYCAEDEFVKPIILDERICQSKDTAMFQWQFSEDDIAQIKQSKSPKTVIKSEIFMMNKLKFQIWLYVCCVISTWLYLF